MLTRVLVALFAFVAGHTIPVVAEEVDFATTVQPLLAKRCFSCHGPDKQEGGLRLDGRDSAIAQVDSGKRPILPGDSSKSELVRRILSRDDAERMPPEGAPLKSDQIESLQRWIDQGAEYASHWAFQPVTRAVPPEVDHHDSTLAPLDAFVVRRLEAKRLELSPPAGPQELIRRVYLDTIGLPPTPEVVAELADKWNDEAYARLVDRLLADPAFGDRWARNWLDVVRYAETNSYERDGVKPNAWKYRDYVVRAMNSDKPYDQFVREQIAGDELDQVTTETLTATGYYRLGIWDDEPADPLQARFDEYDDIVSTTSQAFLALTVNCARCHDHKIDPIPQKDYYGLVAFMRDVTSYGSRGDQALNNQIEITGHELAEKYKRLNGQIRQADQQLRKIEQAAIVKMPGPDQRATEGPEREKVLRAKLKDFLSADESVKYDELKLKKNDAQQELAAMPPREAVLGLAKCDPKPPVTYVLVRGSPQNEGAAVEPSFPKLLGQSAPSIPKMPDDAPTAGRRKVLADWLTSKDNWLTARVMVNRIWQHYFGRGISRSPNNFGLMGDRPTHPELIDHLATELMDHDWSLKVIHRQILLSATYRQSSAPNQHASDIDPDNNLFWRQSVRRLSAEQVRDSVLAVSGQLNEQQFGDSFFQTLSREVLASQSQPGNGWGNSSPADQARRSVYIRIKRSLPVPMLAVFDFPETDISCEARFLTTQPGQALGMLNSDWMQEQSAALLTRVQREVGEDLTAQATRALELVTSRRPLAEDTQELVALVERLKSKHKFSEQQARQAMCLAALNVNQFLYLD
ncbi:MAG: PSD1 domain-containing protein [Pirellulaceae bacterium]|nr:PSD1 domain-containing protein [Pirellulaceae bacterium]